MPSRSSWKNTPSYSSPLEFDHLLLEPVHRMAMVGLRTDEEERERLQEEAIEDWYSNQEKLDALLSLRNTKTGEFVSLNVESKKWVPIVLYKILKLPKRTRKNKKTGKVTLRSDEAALRELMAWCRGKVLTSKREETQYKYKEAYAVCRLIINIRRRRKEISSFLGLRVKKGKLAGPSRFLDQDGRLRSSVAVAGTKTFRFAHRKTPWGTGVNNATFPDKLKSMIIPDDGYELLEIDLNRGESWIYAHLSEDPELLRIHLNNLDFHSETAAAISEVFGEPKSVEWIIANKKGEAFRLRYSGKRVNHATSYRMRGKKGAEVVNKESDETGVTLTVKEFNKAREIWLAKYFMVEQWWREIQTTLELTRTMETPYGRRFTYYDRLHDKTLRDATALVPQSTSVDYLNRGFLRVYHEFVKRGAWGISVLAQTHDSLLCQIRLGDRDDAAASIAQAINDEYLAIKGREFSIPVEVNVGMNWKDLERHELAS